MPGMRMAKATSEDFDVTLNFLQACQQMWDRRPFQWSDPAEDWEGVFDDEDEDKKELVRIRKRIADEERISESDVDFRIIIYEWIRGKYDECDSSWGRVYWAGQILIPVVCDPQKSYLDYSPYLTDFHVAPEQ